MEIDRIGSASVQKYVSQAQAPQPQSASEDASVGKSEKRDQLTLSPEVLLLQKAVQAALEAPEVRAERVSEVRQRIANGTYEIDADRIADKLLRVHDS